MKQKVIVYNMSTDSSSYFTSYEEASKHLDTKASKLHRVANTNEPINNVFLIRTK
jgi:hypothetical protein